MLINYLLSSCDDLQDIPLGNTDFSWFTKGSYIKDKMANTVLGIYCYSSWCCWGSIFIYGYFSSTGRITGCCTGLWGVPGGSVVKNPICQHRWCKKRGLSPWVERSPRGGNGNPLQYSCLGNHMDRGAYSGLQSTGSQRVGHTERLSKHAHWLVFSAKGKTPNILSRYAFGVACDFGMLQKQCGFLTFIWNKIKSIQKLLDALLLTTT